MLRHGLYAVGIALLVLAAVAAVSGVLFAFWWQLLVAGVVLVAGLAFERWRYKPLREKRPDPHWSDTGERFVDPESGRLTGVWFDPRTGTRHYLLIPPADRADARGAGQSLR
jgi:hypothetical protein